MATRLEPNLPPVHEDGQADFATGQTFDGCGGSLIDRGDTLVCSACLSEVWRRCDACGFWYDWDDRRYHF